jgi:hypothetical protein
MEMVDTEDVARLKVNIYRCKTNPSHVHREKGAA